jgi:hypothetical protein
MREQRTHLRQVLPLEERPGSAMLWAVLQDNVRQAEQLEAYRAALTVIAEGCECPQGLARAVLEHSEAA